MTICDPAISPNCPGHKPVDKFRDCLTEALFYADHDATTGTVDGFGVWVGLIIQDMAETLDSTRDLPVTIPAGTFLVLTEDDRGFVGVDQFDTAEDAQARFDTWEAAYGDYRAGQDAREYAIVSSTGRIGS